MRRRFSDQEIVSIVFTIWLLIGWEIILINWPFIFLWVLSALMGMFVTVWTEEDWNHD